MHSVRYTVNFMKNINKNVFIPSLILIISIIFPIYFYPTESSNIINTAFAYCTDKLGWLYRLACIISFVFIFWVTAGKRGDLVLGDENQRPEYNNFTWIAMLFTAGVGTSIIILGFLEPIYYLETPPFGLEPYSDQAFEYAHMYGQFHWGLSAWAFYAPAIVAIGLCIFNKKKNVMTLSSACNEGLGRFSSYILSSIIDIIVVFGIIGSISTSLGLATPVIGSITKTIFNISDKYLFIINLAVMAIWILIFCASLFHGLDKGMRKLSSINIYLAIAFMALIFLYGPSVDIINMEINSLGLYLQNFIRLNLWTEPFGNTHFAESWTVFYWGWWLAFMPMMGFFIARISRGRTIRAVVWGQMLWGTLGCCLSFAVFGGYALHLQYTGLVDLSAILKTGGQTEAIIAILSTLPCKKKVMVLMVVLCFIYLATTITSCAYVLASSTTKVILSTEQPARWNRIFWAILFSALSLGLMMIGGLKAVQTVSIVTGLPMVFVSLLLIRSTYIMLKDIFPSTIKRSRSYTALP